MAKRGRKDSIKNHARKKIKLEGPRATSSSSRTGHHAVRQPVLEHSYHSTCCLKEFLLVKLPRNSRIRRRRILDLGDSTAYPDSFLNTSLVGLAEELPPDVETIRQKDLLAFTQTQRSRSGPVRSGSSPKCSVDEIVDFAIWSLFKREGPSSQRPCHVLCQGFQRSATLVNGEPDLIPFLPGIAQRHEHAGVNILKREPWSQLPGLLGDSTEIILLSLLIDCGLFTKLAAGKDNYYQLSGVPVFELPRSKALQTTDGFRHASQHNKVVSSRSVIHSPARIAFVRSRILYARPSLSKRHEIEFGLKHVHILNRCPSLKPAGPSTCLVHYVFPRHCGLHNVFTSTVDRKETIQPFKDYTIREDVSRMAVRGDLRVPRRLRGSPLVLMEKLHRNHVRCCYVQLLRHFCPVALTSAPSALQSMNTSAGFHEESLMFETQILPHSHSPTTVSGSGDNAVCDGQGSFFHFATPATQVAAFCLSVLRLLLPHDTLGVSHYGRRNWQRLSESVTKFVHMRRFENLTLHEVMHGLHLKCIQWLTPLGVDHAHRLSLTDKRKRQELLGELLYFTFDALLIPLIRSHFYVTESGVHRNRLFYFRHDVWKKLSEPSLSTLRIRMFDPLSAGQVRRTLAAGRLGCSQVRLLPKEIGARPITNLRRRMAKSFHGSRLLGISINAQMTPVFNVLNFERQRNPGILGSALFCVNDIHERLAEFKTRIKHNGSRPLYFVKMDIKSCFDTIPQNNLLEVVESLLRHPHYRLAKHVESKLLPHVKRTGTSQIVNKFVPRSCATDQAGIFGVREAALVAAKRRATIFTDSDGFRTWALPRVLKLLRDHIGNNIVRIGRKHLKQKRGIPQGSVLSSLLCNLFYADFEKRRLDFLCSEPSLLLRLIDDFLLITTDKDQARRFAIAMSDGDQNHGISVNAGKSLVNFDLAVNGLQVPRVAASYAFPYCGLLINPNTLHVTKDRQGKDPSVGNALTADLYGRAGMAFRSRALTSLRIQLHAVLLDKRLNTREQVIVTLCECFAEMAMKMHMYRSSMPRDRRPQHRLIISLIEDAIRLTDSLIKKRPSPERVDLRRSQLCWIAATATEFVLSKKQAQYSTVLVWARQMKRSKALSMRQSSRALLALAHRAHDTFRDHVY